MKKTISKRTQGSNHRSSDKKYDTLPGPLRNILIALLILSVGILLGVASFTIYRVNLHKSYIEKVVGYKDIDTSVTVTSGSAGLNGDTDSLKFGKISQGSGGTRFVIINTTQDVIIEVYFSGDISRFLSVDRNKYIINGGSLEKVPINIDIPSDTTAGEYSGKVHIILLRP